MTCHPEIKEYSIRKLKKKKKQEHQKHKEVQQKKTNFGKMTDNPGTGDAYGDSDSNGNGDADGDGDADADSNDDNGGITFSKSGSLTVSPSELEATHV